MQKPGRARPRRIHALCWTVDTQVIQELRSTDVTPKRGGARVVSHTTHPDNVIRVVRIVKEHKIGVCMIRTAVPISRKRHLKFVKRHALLLSATKEGVHAALTETRWIDTAAVAIQWLGASLCQSVPVSETVFPKQKGAVYTPCRRTIL